MDTSQVLVESIDDADIEYIFGLPGSVIMNTIDKIIDTDIDFISTRHEQTATTMADGYARVTNRPGVTLTHVGPGVANQVLGLAAAYRDNSPIVAIGGNEDLERLGRGIWHEWRVEDVLEPITKWCTRIEQPADAARIMRTALVRSISGTPGPVFIDLPKEISRADSAYPDPDRRFYSHHDLRVPFSRSYPDERDVNAVVQLLADAKRPLIFAGGGCVWSGAGEELQEVVEALGIPLVTSESGRGILPESHPQTLGMIGTRGTDAANAAVETADLIVAVGARFSDTSTKDWSLIDENRTSLVQVDLNPHEFAFQYPVEIAVMADSRAFLRSLKRALDEHNTTAAWQSSEIEEVKSEVDAEIEEFFKYDVGDRISARQFFAALRRERADDAIITQGGGVHSTFNGKLSSRDPYSHLHTVSFGGMGYGYPIALGAKLGAPQRQVICVEGDGGFAMVMQDLETAVRYDIDVNVMVYNNFSHGTQKLRQARLFGERYLGTDVDNPSFDRIAEEFGAYGERVENPNDLEGAIRRTLDHDGPSLLDVIVDPTDWPGTDRIAQI